MLEKCFPYGLAINTSFYVAIFIFLSFFEQNDSLETISIIRNHADLSSAWICHQYMFWDVLPPLFLACMMFCCLYFWPAFHHPINCPPHASKSRIHLSESLQICLPHLSFRISVFSALLCHFFFGMSLFYFLLTLLQNSFTTIPNVFFHFHAFVPHFTRTSKWVVSAQRALETTSLNVMNVFSCLRPHFGRAFKWVVSAQRALETTSLNVTNFFFFSLSGLCPPLQAYIQMGS